MKDCSNIFKWYTSLNDKIMEQISNPWWFIHNKWQYNYKTQHQTISSGENITYHTCYNVNTISSHKINQSTHCLHILLDFTKWYTHVFYPYNMFNSNIMWKLWKARLILCQHNILKKNKLKHYTVCGLFKYSDYSHAITVLSLGGYFWVGLTPSLDSGWGWSSSVLLGIIAPALKELGHCWCSAIFKHHRYSVGLRTIIEDRSQKPLQYIFRPEVWIFILMKATFLPFNGPIQVFCQH